MYEINEAQPMDIYVDPDGVLWRIVSTCSEPTVTAEQVEGYTQGRSLSGSLGGMAAAQANVYTEPAPPIIKPRKGGGVSGLMWQGWKRIFRPEVKKSDGSH